ncbi:MAG: hypothetical protein PHF86_01635 [Candidatus Nanoarchaeia archaeon]|nr:hypothetical protein [Candidatus Nanoarchaeia archaeon]
MGNLGEGLRELGYSESYIKHTEEFIKLFKTKSSGKKFEGGSVASIMTKSSIIEDFIIEEDCDTFTFKGMDGNIYSEKDLI